MSFLDISTLPDKLTYYDGEAIDITGLVVTDNGVVISNTDITYTQYATLGNGFTARSDSIIYAANTLISESNDSRRQPIVKDMDALGAFAIFIDAGGTSYDGDWFSYSALSDTVEGARFRVGNGLGIRETHRYNNLVYYYCGQGANKNWYGATYTTNPLGLPTTSGVKWFTPNQSAWSREDILRLIKFLNFRFNGGAVTIEYNGDFVQYGITVKPRRSYVGVGNTSKKIKQIYVGVNGVPKKVVKGYVGVNGVPKQFW